MERFLSMMRQDAELTEKTLYELVPATDADYGVLLEAERYSLLAGGKRIRPFLVLSFCRLYGGEDKAALPFACAVEMIHTYSLIHDDLPCMDNDDMRRGRPTNHKVYGEANALLAGDGLLTRAFGTAAGNPHVSAELARDAVCALSEAAGDCGMVGGQVIDLLGEEQALTREQLTRLHSLKTGALIRVSALLGCLAAGFSADSAEAQAAVAYADRIGLAFQIIDDVLDVTGDEAQLGKPCGSDADNQKTTFLTFYSIDEARAYAARLTSEAISLISHIDGSELLTDLAVYLLDRDH